MKNNLVLEIVRPVIKVMKSSIPEFKTRILMSDGTATLLGQKGISDFSVFFWYLDLTLMGIVVK